MTILPAQIFRIADINQEEIFEKLFPFSAIKNV